ncbi:MAG: hypothetical protein DRQ55_11660 [Planctomycetota bacterium]|nr:MAG: hypothetical protein DRQ55_11660 [Planctomycetota bacterium]
MLVRALTALASLAGCGGEPAPLPPLGASLMDQLAGATLRDYPPTNLPPDIAPLAQGQLTFRAAPIPVERWRPYPEGGPSGWRCRVELPPGARDPIAIQNGQPVPMWELGEDVPSGVAMMFEREHDRLLASSDAPLVGVSVQYELDAAEVLGEQAGAAPTSAQALAGRETFEFVSRAVIELPAPASLTFPPARLLADELRLSLGVVERGWELVEGVVQLADSPSDGVSFHVEVGHNGQWTQVWSRHLEPDEGFVPARVDLTRWRGQQVALRLTSDPGPAGDNTCDYAVWGDLRLCASSATTLTNTPTPTPGRPHVVLIMLDTLRADRLGLYGYERPTTPGLDAWAARRATTYTDASSTAGWTLPASASILTGLAVHQHGVESPHLSLSAESRTLASRLRAAGYETRAVADGGFLAPRFGLDAGFDMFAHRRTELLDPARIVSEIAGRGSERPLFLMVHTYMVHVPYTYDPAGLDPEHSYDGPLAGKDITQHEVILPVKLRRLSLDADDQDYASRMYDAGIARMDRALSELLEGLQRELGDDTLVVITSDHGDEFFEHGAMGHRSTLYEELLRVPLIVQYPGGVPGDPVAAPVSVLDIVPTVLDVVGLERPDSLPGRSLRGDLPPQAVRVSSHESPLRAVRFNNYKLILGKLRFDPSGKAMQQLFDLSVDPYEQADLSAEEPARVADLTRVLQAFERAWAPLTGSGAEQVQLDQSTLDELEALGYVGGH